MSTPVFSMIELADSGAIALPDVAAMTEMVDLGGWEDQATQVILPPSEVKVDEEGSGTLPNEDSIPVTGTEIHLEGDAVAAVHAETSGEGMMEVEDSDKPTFNRFWRSNCSTTTEKMGFALENEYLFHDVVFWVGEDKEKITAHKPILGICSSVFEELFYGVGAENGKAEEVYEFPDLEPSAFRAMLKFLYTNVFDVTLLNAIGVMRVARAFDVPELLARTGDFLKRNLTEKNSVTLFQAAQLFQEKQLEEAAFDFLLNNFWAMVKTDDFLGMTFVNLCKFLDQDEINISELDFFNAVMRWATYECERQDMKDTTENLRSILGDALALVRFTQMSPKEFALQIVPRFILSQTEVVTIFQHLSVQWDERDGLPAVFCKSESRKTLRVSDPNLLIQNLKTTRLRVRVRHCDQLVPVPLTNPSPSAQTATPTASYRRKSANPPVARRGGFRQ